MVNKIDSGQRSHLCQLYFGKSFYVCNNDKSGQLIGVGIRRLSKTYN